AGAAVPPAAAPALLASTPAAAAPEAILSELYLGNGGNAFSLVESDGGVTWQLVRRVRFAEREPGYHAARLATYRDRGVRATEDPAVLFGRLTAAFDRVPPLSGLPGRSEQVLLRWSAGGDVEPVADPRRAAAMAERLERRWLAFTGCDAAPGAESERRTREGAVLAAAAAAAP
ncbi:MAG TPA: hypothetical protein VHQ65_03235, partial [Thermoanaerobaculia bacterium]|nr:hypothetical protein [Thermoanaerobaculia bacterium]